jgi:hypothetical protein
MARVTAAVDVPRLAAEAEALWYDVARWPTFVDGFGHVVRKEDAWPASGELLWDSTPGGRGRVLERVVRYEARVGQTVEVEDDQLRGEQRVTFEPNGVGCTVRLELRYELKQDLPLPVMALVFARRPLKDALRRTVSRFARELRAEATSIV